MFEKRLEKLLSKIYTDGPTLDWFQRDIDVFDNNN